MADDIQNNWGAQALDTEQNARRWQYNVHEGCAVTVGANAMEIDVASGTVAVAGTRHSVGATTVTLSASQSDPRKDVVYVDSSGAVQVAEGQAKPAKPAGQTGRDTYQPLPPDLSQMDATPLAEIWVGAGVSDITSGDVSDRRKFADLSAANADVESLSTGQLYTEQHQPTYRIYESGGTYYAASRTGMLQSSSDATDVFNAVINDVSLGEEKRVELATGVYQVDPIQCSVPLVFEGETFDTSVKLKDGLGSGTHSVFEFQRSDSNTNGFLGLRNLRVDANKSNNTGTTHALKIGDNMSDGTFNRVFFKNGSGANLLLKESETGSRPPWNHHFTNCWFEWSDTQGAIVQGTGFHSKELFGTQFSNCTFAANDDGIRIREVGERNGKGGVVVNNCHFYAHTGRHAEIISGNKGHQFTNCHMIDAGGDAIRLNGASTFVNDGIGFVNLTIRQTTGSGFYFNTTNHNNIRIVGCHINGGITNPGNVTSLAKAGNNTT